MYAKISYTKNIDRALRYNELKLEQGKAECIVAHNFIKDLDQLTRVDKLDRFQQLISLNERVKMNTLHISLNFHSSEKLSNEQMEVMAKHYMQKIGFDHQPYLAYRHYDTTHPHVHIVTTPIRPNGDRIPNDTFFFYNLNIL